jgi:chorismate-pyruvate lyase
MQRAAAFLNESVPLFSREYVLSNSMHFVVAIFPVFLPTWFLPFIAA